MRSRTILITLGLACLGGGATAALLWRKRTPPAKSAITTLPATAYAHTEATDDAGASHFVHALNDGGLEALSWRCVVVTPRDVETPYPAAPEGMVVRGGMGDGVLAYLRALGPMRFGESPRGLAREVPAAIESNWRNLVALAGGPSGSPPVRVLVKHYPRPDLPGRCTVVHATFYSAFDPCLDHDRFVAQYHEGTSAPEVRGVILDVRKTYQLEGAKPKLIEAAIEVHTELRIAPHKVPFAFLYDAVELGAVARDSSWIGHFEKFGGGLRHGMLWYDRSAGRGEPDPWSCAYRIVGDEGGRDHTVRTASLPAAQQRALMQIVARG